MKPSERIKEIEKELKIKLSNKGVPNFILNKMNYSDEALIMYLDEEHEKKSGDSNCCSA